MLTAISIRVKLLSTMALPQENSPKINTERISQLIIDAVLDYAIFSLDPEGNILTWNKGAKRLKGFSAQEIIGQHFSKFYTKEDIDAGKPPMELRVATQEGSYTEEGWRVRKDGTLFWAHVTITAIKDEQGVLTGFAKVTKDLTERKQKDEALREIQENYRLLIDHVKDYAIIMLDPRGRITSWNSGAEKIIGYEAQEILGQHFSKFYTDEDLGAQKPSLELKIAEGVGRFEEEGWRLRKDGTRIWANVVVTAIHDEQGILRGFSKVTRDITERRKIDEKLRQSEERARLMTEGVKDYAIFMLDPNGIVSSWNAGAERIKQYKASEIIGEHFSKFYPKVDIDNLKPEMELREASARGHFEDEGWRIRKDGTKFWASVILTAVHDRKGNLIGFSKITRDLTERKLAEGKLKELNESLEKKVEERTGELRELTKTLEKALNSRDEFLSLASHELKTPLTTLKLQTQMRKRSLEIPDKAYSLDKLKRIADDDEKQINRLNRLVDDMLDITRLGKGKFKIHKEEVDLTELVGQVLERFRPQLDSVECKISFISPGKVLGNWDAFRIEQAVTNLLTNAMKYGPRKPIEVSVRVKEGLALFEIQDRGVGIAPKDFERIFLQFERATASNEVSGLGLGLFIVNQIVQAHQGRVRVESKVGEGSLFIMELPTHLRN
jgi:PAS domain S-box-containing protein